MKIKKYIKMVLKCLLIIPAYLFLLIEGFVGGTDGEDIWDDLMKWIKK